MPLCHMCLNLRSCGRLRCLDLMLPRCLWKDLEKSGLGPSTSERNLKNSDPKQIRGDLEGIEIGLGSFRLHFLKLWRRCFVRGGNTIVKSDSHENSSTGWYGFFPQYKAMVNETIAEPWVMSRVRLHQKHFLVYNKNMLLSAEPAMLVVLIPRNLLNFIFGSSGL